jgi:hydrogenase expression/formation protein HypD
MAIARFGIRDLLPENVRLVSGPGCPVCVTDAGYVDAAVELARRGVVVATFGDMLRVPGSDSSLAEARGEGGRVEVCHSPGDAARLAAGEPEAEVVFLGIGFETTTAPVTALVRDAVARGTRNLSVLTAFKLVPPALYALVADPEVEVNGFICPAHVSAVIGSEAYRPFVQRHAVPCVVAGFEPLDILLAIASLVEQLAEGRPDLVNQYGRVVRPEGNRVARDLMARHLREVDAAWRGIGVIPASGMGLRRELEGFDAAVRHGVVTEGGAPDGHCRCGDVLKGKIRPDECPLFGTACTPTAPVGPCMVSSEGSCAAHFKYVR